MDKPATPADGPSLATRIGDLWDSLDGTLQAIVLIGLAAATLAGFIKWLRPLVRQFFSDLRAIRDTLVGRPAMRDSITQRVVPGTARPSIGERMASQETAMSRVAQAVDKLADATTRLDDHERRLSRVEDAMHLDRRLDKIESVQMLRTIETVAQAEPPEHPPTIGDDRPDL